MQPFRIGVIGAGGLANGIHLPVLSREENVTLVAVCDLHTERAVAAKENYGFAASYVSYHEMLSNETLDAVYVLTEPELLFRAARDSLQAGNAVFMEKPMGVTSFQANTLRALAHENDRLLHVGYNRRYIPVVVEALRLLRKHTTLTQAEGRFYKNSSPAFYGGCATAFTCDVVHCLDLVRYAAGGAYEKGALLESCADNGEPESWHGIMRFDNGVNGVVRSHYATGGRVHEFEFHGPGASAFINLGFGNEGCSATVLLGSGGTQSLSAKGLGEMQVIELDGKVIADSERYEDYYGYRDETRLFLAGVAAGGAFDSARADEDYASALLAEQLLEQRI
jgi:predicted dehydrogenase